MRNEEGKRNCHRPEDTKTRQLNTAWYPESDSGTGKKDISGKTGEIQIKFGVRLVVTPQCCFLSVDGYTMVK